MTRSALLAVLLEIHGNGLPLSPWIIDTEVGSRGDWRALVEDLISLGIVARDTTSVGNLVFRIRGWRPIHVFSESQEPQMSLVAQGVVPDRNQQRMNRMYRNWMEGKRWAEREERRTA